MSNETINKLTQIQEKRSVAFEHYVKNQARLGAFHMAAMRFKEAVNYDREKADYYSHKMDVIMGEVEETNEDDDDDEFDLEGINMEDDFGKMVESMPVLPVPAPARVAKAARRNEPDDENEVDEPPAQPRRSGRSAVAAKPAPSKRTKTKRAAV